MSDYSGSVKNSLFWDMSVVVVVFFRYFYLSAVVSFVNLLVCLILNSCPAH